MNPTVQIDMTTAADFKGLFQTIIVRRFKNTIGIRYDMVQTNDILQFNSRAVLFGVADNYDYIKFPATGICALDGEKFKVRSAPDVMICYLLLSHYCRINILSTLRSPRKHRNRQQQISGLNIYKHISASIQFPTIRSASCSSLNYL